MSASKSSPPMKVVVTGANGFVGLNIVAGLVEAGHRAVAYVRAGSKVDHLQAFGIEIVRGELHDEAALAAAMSGAGGVIHTAGNTSCNRRDWPLLEAANVHGTQAVVRAAIASAVPRLVYTSTTSTIGASDDPSLRSDENTPLTGFRARSPYALSKQMGEQAVLDGQRHGLECVILNPAEVLGAYDHNLQWGRMLLAVQYNQVPFLPPGGGSFCHAGDVGRAHVAALTQGRSGQRYLLAGHDVRYIDFLDAIAATLDKNFDRPEGDYRRLYLKSVLQEKFPRLFPGKPIVEPYRMKVFAGTYYFDSAKAERELSYRSAPLETMLRDCADWYRSNGFIGRDERPEITDNIGQEDATWIPER